MSGKNLTFKLVMDADSKGLVSNVKQSEAVVKSVFDSIKQESNRLKQATADTSKEVGNIVPKGTSELANKLKNSLDAASGIIKNAGDNAKSTANNFTDFGNKSHRALEILKADLVTAKQKLESFTKTNATPVDIELAKLKVDQLEKEVQQTDKAYEKFQQEVGRANSKLIENGSATESAQKGIQGLKNSYSALISVMAGIGVGLGIRDLAETADSYTNLSARINIATRDNGDFESAMAGVHLVALQTNSSLQATGDLFTRLNTVGKDMGMTQKQALDLTKTVTQAIQIGGGSAQASEAAVTQFIQAMQGGVLRGEEFNSIMENGYGLAEALAKGLGVTTGELRKMAENGELSAERVITAVQKQASAVQKTYDQFPTTIGNALQRITTSWEILIGKMDQSNGASATVAQWLVTLADNIAELDVVLNDIGEGFVWVGDQLKKIDPATIEALKTALLSIYDSIKTLGSTVGIAFEAVVDVINTVLLQLFNFGSGVDTASDKTNGFTKVLQLINVAIGALSDGFAAIGIGVNLFVGALYSVGAAWANLASKFTWGDVKEEALANLAVMQAKSEEYYQKASDGALSFKSKAVEALNEIGKTQQQKDAEAVASSKAKLDQLLLDQQTEVNAKKASEEEKLSAVQAYAEATIAANKGVMDGVMQADLMTKGYIVTVDQAGKVSVEAWSNAENSAGNSTKAIEKARVGAKALGLDLDVALNRVSEKFTASQKSVIDLSNGLEGMGLKGSQAANILYQAWVKWLETAKSQAEIDFAKAKLKEFGDQGKISTSQVEMGMQAIRQVVQKLPADIDPVTAAFERLGIKTKEQLALAAQSALADFNTIQSSGQATAESLKQAYERTMQAAAASGDQAVIAATQAKAASLGLQVQVDQTGKATVTSLDEVSSSVDRVGRSFDGLKGHARSAGEVMREEARSSTEEWAAALDAMKGKMHASKTGTTAKTGYSVEEIEQQLIDMGYTSGAKNKAKELFDAAHPGAGGGYYKSASHEWMKEKYGTSMYDNQKALGNGMFIMEQLEKLNPPTARNQVASLNAPSLPSVPVSSNEPTKTVEYKFMSGGQEVSLYGSPNDGNAMEALLSEFEMLKRSS